MCTELYTSFPAHDNYDLGIPNNTIFSNHRRNRKTLGILQYIILGGHGVFPPASSFASHMQQGAPQIKVKHFTEASEMLK